MDYYESNSRAVTCLNTALKSLVTQKVPNRDNSSAAGTAIYLNHSPLERVNTTN